AYQNGIARANDVRPRRDMSRLLRVHQQSGAAEQRAAASDSSMAFSALINQTIIASCEIRNHEPTLGDFHEANPCGGGVLAPGFASCTGGAERCHPLCPTLRPVPRWRRAAEPRSQPRRAAVDVV